MNRIYKRAAALLICMPLCLGVGFTGAPAKSAATKSKAVISEEKYDQRILFLGNSFTYYNNLPKMFKLLAKSGGYNVLTDSITKSGGSLGYYDETETNPAVKKICDAFNQRLKKKWDIVVLQEQSTVPLTADRDTEMYPMIRALNKKITANGSQTMLFMTWGYKDGDKEDGFPTFEDMSVGIKKGYMGIARELSIPVSPVGMAFQRAREEDKDIDLWADENSHPTVEGTYLAACVFYAEIYKKSPVSLTYTAGLPSEKVEFLQKVAEETYLDFIQ